MPLSDIISISITTESAKVLQAGFGVPLILSPRPAWTERVRRYSDLSGLVADGFASTTPEYMAANKIFAQNPRPEEVVVGRCANKPTQRWAITPVAANATTYRMWIDDLEVSMTSDSSATVTEIIAGLKTAIDALGKAVTVSDQTTYMRIVANVAGTFFSVEVEDTAKLGVSQDHADPGLAADLAAIKLEDNSWYTILHLFNSKACIEAIATFAEANTKLFIAQSQDTAIITTSLSGTDDVGESLANSAFARTALIYHPETAAFADAAWGGRCLPLQPGSETWKFKTLATVPAVSLTDTHRSNLRAKNVNFYETVAGVNITQDGVVSANEFIDVIRFRDWLQARMQERIFFVLATTDKVAFTDAGIAAVEGEMRAQLQDGVDVGGLSRDPAPTVTVPKAKNVSVNDRAARHLAGLAFSGHLAGAIHDLAISGVISV